MSLGYSDKILPYPGIEYIPITIRKISFTKDWANNYKNKLYIIDNLNQAQKILHSYQLNHLITVDFNKNLLILLLNGHIHDIYYRSYNVQLIGNLYPNSYHLFSITKKYFYKDRLLFNFFIPNGDRILKTKYHLDN